MSKQLVKLAESVVIPGFVPGASASLHLFTLAFDAETMEASTIGVLAARVTDALVAPESAHATLKAPNALLHSIVIGAWQLLNVSGKPRFPVDRVLIRPSSRSGVMLGFQLPANCNPAMRIALQAVLDLVNDASGRKGHSVVKRAKALLGRQHPTGINPKVIVEYAGQSGVAITSSSAHYYMLGIGRQARWLASSITDRTSSMGVSQAKDKFLSLSALRQAGLPVPQQRLVRTMAEAKVAAKALGYPLVLKPVALDKGEGVIAGIHDEAMLQTAFEHVATISERMVLEKFVEGLDLRFTIVNGESQRIVARRAAAVEGDGASSIAELIAQHNRRTTNGELMETGYPIHRIEVDWETEHWLAHQGLAMDAVPEIGRHIRLKGAANSSKGGMGFYATDVHPDLIAMAKRAVRVLHLDIGGVDMLVPDYTRSWREQTVGICEINAQPQLSGRTMKPLFESILPTGGRVPVVVVLGTPEEHEWYPIFCQQWAAQNHGVRLGTALPNGVWLGDECLAGSGRGAYADGMMLALDPELDAMMLFITEHSSLRSGMPVNRVDVLLAPGSTLLPGEQWRADWLRVYQDMCVEVVSGRPSGGSWIHSLSGEMLHSVGEVANIVKEALVRSVPTQVYSEAAT